MPETPANRLLIVQVAAMGYRFLDANDALDVAGSGLTCRGAQSVFPAVTCSVQASFRTASPPAQHGMVANGLFYKDLLKVLFWEQSAALVEGPRIWDDFRRRGRSVGLMFWQQSLAEKADLLLSPAPIHKHHGGMIQDCYSQPDDLYDDLVAAVGRPFDLKRYWGPMASPTVGDWIAEATCHVLESARYAPDCLLTYLPTLDYDLQRFGPDHRRSRKSLAMLRAQLSRIVATARRQDYDVLIFGDYAIAPARRAVFPNLALRDAELFGLRTVKSMTYPDFYTGKAFAVVDHEIAHVYVRQPEDTGRVRDVLQGLDGVADVLEPHEQSEIGLDHARSGEVLLIAEPGCWFAYPWWRQKHQAPDYATHVDIHNKPGFDPCELNFGWPPLSISLNTSRIRGTHGGVGPGREIAWAASWDPNKHPADLPGLAAAVRERLEQTEEQPHA
ncbi:MAG: alkaline phosphatase family protein [Planctomycetes bacterium]|jgi:predicted AlkP superfamily pyrophosphatase or phosphodiesterase|nr:alkaline phosphatase family protein [Planctomycetota bacterium]